MGKKLKIATGKEEKREAEENIGCNEGGYGGSGAREKDIENRTMWRNIICCGNP